MQYLWQFYLLIAIILFQGILLTGTDKKRNIIFAWLCFVELAFISGFRSWNIGNDTLPYVETFIRLISFPDLLQSHMEAGYLLFNRFLTIFTTNPQVLLLCTSMFIIGTWMYTLYKYSNSIMLAVLLFVVLGFSNSMNILRQEMAMCVILLSIPFIIRRQFFSFFICWCISVSFHYSSFITLILYFLYPLEFKFRYLIWIILFTILSLVFLAPILEKIIAITGRYAVYLIDGGLLGEQLKLANIMNTLVQFVITTFCLFSYIFIYNHKLGKSSPLKVSFLLWCSILAFCLQCISIRAILLERIVLCMSIFNFISLPFFVHCYPRKSRVFIAIGIIGCFVLYQSIVFVYRPGWNHVLPFEFCF
ncbi:MAG: EpsG family protein [Elusimicrobiaceae bacterium]|nr:EpsG family protein [Elusimicrobiaceae bacterium]